MTQLFVNNFSTTVSQTFGIADTSLYLTSVVGLPALTGGNHLLITVFRKTGVEEREHEVVRVTAITGNMLTVVRAVEGAAATQFLIGDRVEARVTANALLDKADLASTAPLSHVGATGAAHGNAVAGGAAGFMTGADKTKLDAVSGTNTGDQTSIVGITGTLAQFNAAVTDADLASLSGVESLTNKTITDTVFALTGTTPAFTATNGAMQTWTLTAASTPTNALTSGQSIILVITPGAFAVTWPSVTWTKQGGSGAAPTLFSAGKTSVVLWMLGAVLYGSHLGDTV